MKTTSYQRPLYSACRLSAALATATWSLARSTTGRTTPATFVSCREIDRPQRSIAHVARPDLLDLLFSALPHQSEINTGNTGQPMEDSGSSRYCATFHSQVRALQNGAILPDTQMGGNSLHCSLPLSHFQVTIESDIRIANSNPISGNPITNVVVPLWMDTMNAQTASPHSQRRTTLLTCHLRIAIDHCSMLFDQHF